VVVIHWEGGDPASANQMVDAENPYESRDPRFYANILYNGADWWSRPSGLANLERRWHGRRIA